MLFSSVEFICYFLPAILILYYLVKPIKILKNLVLLIFSIIFYSWGEPTFVIIMFASIFMNYIFGYLVYKVSNEVLRKIFIVLMVIGNLSILFVFKYYAFTVGIINDIGDLSLIIPEIALPIGISFFTFQAMSYVIDVYRKPNLVEKNIFNLALYISFFPQLVAGPIVRYESIADQLKNREETISKFSAGSCRFMIGLSKKVLLSNNLAIIADQVYLMNVQGALPTSLAWVGSIAYMLQIFFDFSAYSDMAIGLGLMFGFKFEENFNYPYISKSITEFWRRWHISLSSWFKSYVYFPLGGSRVKNKDRMVLNLLIVWMLTGLWHGAAWTFILWGLFNFVFIVFEKVVDFENIKINKFFKHLYALFIINIAWVLFRAESLSLFTSYIKSMFGFGDGFFSDTAIMFLREYCLVFGVAILLSIPVANFINKQIINNKKIAMCFYVLYPTLVITLFVISLTYLITGSYNPFIYFNF